MTQHLTTEVAIVGAGPAGLAVADALQRDGRHVLLFDKGAVGQAISEFPTFMTFFSTRDLLELAGVPLTIAGTKPTRQEYLVYLNRFVAARRLDVRTYHAVEALRRDEVDADHPFLLDVRSPHHGAVQVRARFVVIANGCWDQPIMLGLPGEDLPKVSHRYTEPYRYVGRRVMVVGGRNSAIEAALDLWREGAEVDLSYRRAAFTGSGIKYWVQPDIENRLKNGEIHDHLGTVPVSFHADHVRLRRVAEGTEYDVPNDFVLCLTGYAPDLRLLRAAGVDVDPDTRCPAHDPETFESNVPGLFLAGVILQGSISGKIFIENSRHHGERIAAGMKRHERVRTAASAAMS